MFAQSSGINGEVNPVGCSIEEAHYGSGGRGCVLQHVLEGMGGTLISPGLISLLPEVPPPVTLSNLRGLILEICPLPF